MGSKSRLVAPIQCGPIWHLHMTAYQMPFGKLSMVQETTPEEVRRKTPDVYHPLVNTHPETGKKALYLDPATTAGIEGMPEDEGLSLLQELATHAASPAFVYRHVWQPGDIIMWDNGFLLHRRDAFATNQNRLLKRTTIRLSEKRHILPGL